MLGTASMRSVSTARVCDNGAGPLEAGKEGGEQGADDEDPRPVDLPAVVPGSRPQEREPGMAERLARPCDERDHKAEEHRGEHQRPQPAQERVGPTPPPGAVALDGLPNPCDGDPVL